MHLPLMILLCLHGQEGAKFYYPLLLQNVSYIHLFISVLVAIS